MMSVSLQGRSLLHMTSLIGKPASITTKLMAPLQKATFSARSGDFSFPKHKEVLTDDFYDYEASAEDSNPYVKQRLDDDFEDYTQPTHRSTTTGVLSSYKK